MCSTVLVLLTHQALPNFVFLQSPIGDGLFARCRRHKRSVEVLCVGFLQFGSFLLVDGPKAANGIGYIFQLPLREAGEGTDGGFPRTRVDLVDAHS
mgnify:CR=1 FL=1